MVSTLIILISVTFFYQVVAATLKVVVAGYKPNGILSLTKVLGSQVGEHTRQQRAVIMLTILLFLQGSLK